MNRRISHFFLQNIVKVKKRGDTLNILLQILQQYEVMSFDNLISSSGGLIGLWIGMSFLTVFQAIDFFICFLKSVWNRDAVNTIKSWRLKNNSSKLKQKFERVTCAAKMSNSCARKYLAFVIVLRYAFSVIDAPYFIERQTSSNPSINTIHTAMKLSDIIILSKKCIENNRLYQTNINHFRCQTLKIFNFQWIVTIEARALLKHFASIRINFYRRLCSVSFQATKRLLTTPDFVSWRSL